MQRFREPINGFSHLIPAVLAALSTIGLVLIGRENALKSLSLLVYGSTLALMFASSAAYHLTTGPEKLLNNLRKLDHIAIFLVIAGTYTPICLTYFEGVWKWGMLGLVWLMALVGTALKVADRKKVPHGKAGIYLVMGWFCLLAIPQMLRLMPAAALVWLLVGGAFYSVGAVIYSRRKLNLVPGVFGHHELWHVFVILGAASHFLLIVRFIAPA